jgi:hypothetical protein
MSILVISGETLVKKEWDVEKILTNDEKRNTKDKVERMNWVRLENTQRVNEFYETSYLNLEYSKSL